MDERRAHIDLAFRNGLKDFEVLPPPDVWNSIDSRLVRKERPVYLFRAAAFLAIALTLSVLAYRWTGRTSALVNSTSAAMDEESSRREDAFKPSSPLRIVRTGTAPVAIKEPVADLAQNIVSEQPSASENTGFAGAVSLPSGNIRMPSGTPYLTLIRHNDGLNTPASSGKALTVDNVQKEFQDYLAVSMTADNTVANTRKWSISALASPTYYGTVSMGGDDMTKQMLESEKSMISYSGGVTLAYKVTRRLSVQSGLIYSSVGQELDGISSYAGFQKYDYTKGDHNFEVLTTNGKITTSNADVFLADNSKSNRVITSYNKDVFDPQKASLDYVSNTMKQTFSYLELPVFLRYKVIDKTVDFNLIGGLSYNMLINNSVYTVIDGNKYMIGTTEGLNMFSISSSLGLGMEYKFSDTFSMNLEPTFRYYLNTFNNSAASQVHPYTFGIFTGLTYKF